MEHLLTTKILIPPGLPKRVSRRRLLEQLDQALSRKLFLLSAPAGFGKTTLVQDWVSRAAFRTVWFSLDAGDSDPARFLNYLVSALRLAFPQLGEQVQQMVRTPQLPPLEMILTPLINQLSQINEEFVLVLDDYHLIDEPLIDQALIFLLENLPAHMHLVITTREDPQLPLARYRARNQLGELRVGDLRFAQEETERFLNEIMQLELPEADLTLLEKRTEGWAAGLQLAAISMQGQADKQKFIQSFSGSHHYVMDFLVEEVLNLQPENIQTFLYQTSILDRLTGPLCDALVQDPQLSGQEVLEKLHQANLFILPLDEERRWFRYHHLFMDLLRQRLAASSGKTPGLGVKKPQELHLRASLWFEENGFLVDAFQHAVAAQDLDRAECLLAGKGMPLQYRGAMTPILRWLGSLPEAVLKNRPTLRVVYASTLTIMGKPVENVELLLSEAEEALKNTQEDERVRDTLGQIAAIRAMLAIPKNEIDTLISEANKALPLLYHDNLPVRTTVSWLLGFAHQLRGNRKEAEADYRKAFKISQASGNLMISIATAIGLGQVLESENRLDQAKTQYETVLTLTGQPPFPFACEALLGLARIHYQQGNLEPVEGLALQSLDLARQLPNVDTPISVYLLLAEFYAAQGKLEETAEVLQKAESFAFEFSFPHRLPQINARKVDLYLRTGDFDSALSLTRDGELPLSLGKVKLAVGDPAAALAVLGPYREEMEEKTWAREQLEALLLEAVCEFTLGHPEEMQALLNRALVLAAQGKMLRVFVDQGETMVKMFSALSVPPNLFTYRVKILKTLEAETRPLSSFPGLIEPLSEREIEILDLIARGCSNREIADRLYLALNTVKGHNRNLFGKLNAKSRTDAVARARELGVI